MGRPRAVGVVPSRPLKDSPASVVAEVVEVATAARLSTPISAALCRKPVGSAVGREAAVAPNPAP